MSSKSIESSVIMKLDNPKYHFEKVFRFQKGNRSDIPQKIYKSPKFEMLELQDMKCQLNKVKGLLDQFNLNEWSKHTHHRDGSSFIMDYLKRRVKPELLTQAWCKFYEIVSKFPIVPRTNSCKHFKSLHLCEAPGAFVSALNHFLALNYPNQEWSWLANSLNPDYEGNNSANMIPDDRLIQHTRNNWYFGLDMTGDIQKYYNHKHLVQMLSSEGKVHLVTADGSVNCMDDPGEQERIVEFLHYCEAMTALAVLQTGGSFVLKIFTIFEDTTICLLYLLNCVFEHVSIFKPSSSKSGNSELYVICNNYLGFELLEPIWDQLLIPYKMGNSQKFNSMFFMEDIPYSFILQILSCCSDFFIERQISVIRDNVYYFQNKDEHDGNVNFRKMAIAELYMKKYRVRSIDKYRRLVPYAYIHKFIKRCENRSNYSDFLNYNITKNVFTSLSGVDNLEIKLGKRIDEVFHSKFMSRDNLEEMKLQNSDCRLNPLSLMNVITKQFNTNFSVISLQDCDDTVYYKFQRQLFLDIKAFFNENKYKNLIFLKIPLHTHFLAGLFWIILQGFEYVYFNSGLLVLTRPIVVKFRQINEVLDKIEDCYRNIKHYNFYCDILHLVPVCVLESESFINILNVYNNKQ